MHISQLPHQALIELTHDGRLYHGKLYIANNGTRVLYAIGEDWVYSPTLDELYLSKPSAPDKRLPPDGWSNVTPQPQPK